MVEVEMRMDWPSYPKKCGRTGGAYRQFSGPAQNSGGQALVRRPRRGVSVCPRAGNARNSAGIMRFPSCLPLLCGVVLAAAAFQARAGYENPPTKGPTVPGNRAVLKGRIAYAPANAPEAVKRAIWATNFLTDGPTFGAAATALFTIAVTIARERFHFSSTTAACWTPRSRRRGFSDTARVGTGKWVTIYARSGHVFAVSRRAAPRYHGIPRRRKGRGGGGNRAHRWVLLRAIRRVCRPSPESAVG